MEKFGLLNLIRALSGQYEQSGDGARTENADGADERPAAQKDGAAERANVLAAVIERHEQISYRIKNGKKK